MKDGKTQSQDAQSPNRHKSTISWEINRNMGNRGCHPGQICLLAEERSQSSRNATHISPEDLDQTIECLENQSSPEQITGQVSISHETIYRHLYADKIAGGSLYQQLRSQKKRKMCYVIGRDRRGQIVGRGSISERSILKGELKSIIRKAIL